ncbi:MAG: ABC transporter ATP-binding protein, partial [Acidobacteria bacterium]|nr:ABC transporter ATP-binding protein [Acidobacteriota bacterium]
MATLASAGAVLVEGLLFRGLISITQWLGAPRLRWGATAAATTFLLAVAGLEAAARGGSLRLARALEIRFREAFLERLPRLSDRYFATRWISDLAHRAHGLHQIHEVGHLTRHLVDRSARLLFLTLGLLWLAPTSWAWTFATSVTITVLPLVFVRLLGEADLRLRNHAGALSRFALDGLQGQAPVLAHGAEEALHRRHETLLAEWLQAARRLIEGSVGAEALQSVAGYGLVLGLLLHHQASRGTPDLLFVYWALELRTVGKEIAGLLHQWPTVRSAVLRAAEVLNASELDGAAAFPEAPEAAAPPGGASAGVHLEIRQVTVEVAGHRLLGPVDLEVRPGEHLAVVGPSGAGK